MLKTTSTKALRKLTLLAAREAARLGDVALAQKLFAEVGISYVAAVAS